ncbi:hypothetical protein DXG03_009430 [Asterophora parasitica]|uniref:non-specific serine/threonine protein kinase n=1 Tax=Asterophora parasitica TaxID=117018 RepID=A0A9P7GF26_9AGAR|nr:hypothetical protein DXG03_009430 [Asterophora parasitica]
MPEPISMYRKGGYHPIDIGDVFRDRYRVFDKLGHGTFATVWLVEDILLRQFAAFKVHVAEVLSLPNRGVAETVVSRHLKEYQEQNPDAFGAEHVVKILDLFEIHGPNGTHSCIVTELLGPNLNCDQVIYYEEDYDQDSFPIDIARQMCAQIARGLVYLHNCGIVHGDLHKGNVLLYRQWSSEKIRKYFGKPRYDELTSFVPTPHMPKRLVRHWKPQKDLFLSSADVVHVKVCDFSEAFLTTATPQLPFRRLGTPLPYCAPEVIFHGITLPGPPTDIWALAVLFYMLRYHNTPLFSSDHGRNAETTLIREMVGKLGKLPPQWWDRLAERKEIDDEDGPPGRVEMPEPPPKWWARWTNSRKKLYREDGPPRRWNAKLLPKWWARWVSRNEFRDEDGPDGEEDLLILFILESSAPMEESVTFDRLIQQMVRYEMSERITAEEVVHSLPRIWTGPVPKD